MGKEISKALKFIYKSILDIIYPPESNCIVCGEEQYIGLCPLCKVRIKRMESVTDVITYGFYGNVLKELILQFKYHKNFIAGDILSEFLVQLIEENNVKGDVICYVPMTRKSKRKRGFNQCELIANYIGDKFNIPVSNSILKIISTSEQKTLSKDERFKNIKGAFSIKNSNEILNKDIILIDDVITTGATINECIKILKKFGADKITVLTIAKSNI